MNDTGALRRLLDEKFGKIKAIRSTRTNIALDTLKETSYIPLIMPLDNSHE